MAAPEHPVGHRRRSGGLSHRPLAGQRHRKWLHAGTGHRSERRRHRPRAVVGRGRMDGRHRCTELPAGQGPRVRALPTAAREELGALFPHDRRSQGRRLAVHRRGPPVPVHRWAPGDAHPHGAAQSDEPRVRAGHLHRNRRRARHDHDDDGLLGGRRAAGELADPAHDRLTAHGLSPRRGLLVLDLHGGLSGHPECALLRRVSDRVDRLRPPADAGNGGDGRVPGGLRRHRDRHDHGRLQPGGHDHQLPSSRHDAGAGCRSSPGASWRPPPS